MQDIMFSVLVPVYKVEKYIDECILSVVNQDYPNWELILVDDGSPDRSGEICDAYAEKDSRIRVYHKKNEGQLATRLQAQSYALGNYYVYLDSDDSLKLNALSVIYRTIVEYNSDCVIYGYENVRDNVVVGKTKDEKTKTYTDNDKRALYKKVFQDSGYNSLCRKAVKADIIKNKGYSDYYHIAYSEDLLQSIELYRDCKKITFIPERLYNYRVNPASMTHSIDYSNYKVDFTVRKKVLEFLRQENVFSEEDYEEYREYCERNLSEKVLTILRFQTSLKNKERLIAEIANIEYCKAFVLQNRNRPDMYLHYLAVKTIAQKAKYRVLSLLKG